jgi:hypothetical protein
MRYPTLEAFDDAPPILIPALLEHIGKVSLFLSRRFGDGKEACICYASADVPNDDLEVHMALITGISRAMEPTGFSFFESICKMRGIRDYEQIQQHRHEWLQQIRAYLECRLPKESNHA